MSGQDHDIGVSIPIKEMTRTYAPLRVTVADGEINGMPYVVTIGGTLLLAEIEGRFFHVDGSDLVRAAYTHLSKDRH